MVGKASCNLCGKKYAFDGFMLKRHIERIHFGKTDFPVRRARKRGQNEIREQKCDECDYKTTTTTDLKHHKQSEHGNVKFPCNICEYQGKSERTLSAHKRTTHSIMKYFCEFCPYKTGVNGKRNFLHHIKYKHGDGVAPKIYSCGMCEATFVHSKSIAQHVKIIHEGFRISCNMCEYKTTQKIHLKTHMNSVHLKIKDYACSECGNAFSSKYHLSDHIKAVHLKEKLKCPQCDFETTHKSYIRTHILVKHEKKQSKRFKFKCDLCDYENTSKTHMNYHRNMHKGIRVPCDQCDYTATTKYVLKEHVKNKHTFSGELNEKVKCEKCEKLFKSKGTMLRHFESSHEGKRYDCNICDFKATQKGYLRKHSKRKHFPKLSSCSICSKEIVSIDMRQHINNQHNESQVFKCEECSFQTKYKKHLNKHKETHSDIKPVLYCDTCVYKTHNSENLKSHKKNFHGPSIRALKKCQFCDRTFTNDISFQKHELTHQNHVCNECKTKFATKRTLKNHIKSFHPLDFWKMEFKSKL